MNINEYFYVLFLLIFILFSSIGCNNGTKTNKRDKISGKKKVKTNLNGKKKLIFVKNVDSATNDKNENDRTGNKDVKKSMSRKSIKPPRFYPDVNQMKFDGKKEISLKVEKTQSKILSLPKDFVKYGDLKTERFKITSDNKKIPLDKTLPSSISTKNKIKVKHVMVKASAKENGKISLIEGGLQSSKRETKVKNDEELSNPDLNKETKDETTNIKDKVTDITKEPSQRGGIVKEKVPDEPKPKKIELDEKEKLIATGAIAKKKKTDYPTMDDVLSDWDTEKEKAAQTHGKSAPSDSGKKQDSGSKKPENEKQLDIKNKD